MEDKADIASQLIKLGADVNLASFNGITPLHLAAAQGHVELVKELLDSGAEHDAITATGETATHFAAKNGYPDIVGICFF